MGEEFTQMGASWLVAYGALSLFTINLHTARTCLLSAHRFALFDCALWKILSFEGEKYLEFYM